MAHSNYNGFQHFSPHEPVDDPELQAVDALLTAAGERWQRIHMSAERANKYLDDLVEREHFSMSTKQPETMPSRPQKQSFQGERLIMKTSWRTTFIGIALTLCLVAGSVGVFVVLSHHQHGASVASKPTASPTPSGPLTMPAALVDLAMVSDHEGWALQNLATLSATPTTSPVSYQLWHLHNGAWEATAIPGLASPYTASLAMVSPTSGWLMATSWNNATPNMSMPIPTVVYHYDGSAWHQTNLPHLQGAGTPELDVIHASAGGDAWITGNYLNLSGKKEMQVTRVPLSVLSCLPNCGHTLVLHWEQGQWMEVTVPANVTIFADNGTLGWFPGTETDQMTLYHYQSGAWTKIRLSIAASPTWVAMATPTDGWVGAYIPKNPGANDNANTFVVYHFDGKTVQRIADVENQHCFGFTSASANAINPDEIWVPLISDQDCGNSQQLWHLRGKMATMTSLPSPYVVLGVQNDASGNTWLLAAQKSDKAPGKPVSVAPYDNQHEAILRWNGSTWVLFAQTQA